jgi:hypothetical protein
MIEREERGHGLEGFIGRVITLIIDSIAIVGNTDNVYTMDGGRMGQRRNVCVQQIPIYQCTIRSINSELEAGNSTGVCVCGGGGVLYVTLTCTCY